MEKDPKIEKLFRNLMIPILIYFGYIIIILITKIFEKNL
jgi:hypothetical protein